MLAATSDGASVNRRFIQLHDTSNKLLYKFPNKYAEDGMDLYFFADPPHLMKTTRNCWSSNNRTLWVCLGYLYHLHSHCYMLYMQKDGSDILWEHLVALYNRDGGRGSGMAMITKLKFEHLYLNSFAKMRVDLATQV